MFHHVLEELTTPLLPTIRSIILLREMVYNGHDKVTGDARRFPKAQKLAQGDYSSNGPLLGPVP
jgi:hypothetical protein